jgi:hypothetical protein
VDAIAVNLDHFGRHPLVCNKIGHPNAAAQSLKQIRNNALQAAELGVIEATEVQDIHFDGFLSPPKRKAES